jgi:FkbM family methyltransferase
MRMTRLKQLVRRLLPDRAYRVYRRRKIAAEVAGYERRIVSHLYGATRLTVELCDPLGEGWYDRDWPALPELERLRAHGLRPGARVFDVGAHQAVVALMLADAVGDGGHVIAVEAEPHNARAAERNRQLSGVENLEIVHAAGAAKEGTVLFAEGLNGHVEDEGSAWGKVEVAAVTVDGLAARYGRPDVVLVDVEGFEGEVLDGAEATIAAGGVTFLVEVHVNHGLGAAPERIAERFDAGYQLAVAPVEQDLDVFEPYVADSPVVRDRFFLLATPRR